MNEEMQMIINPLCNCLGFGLVTVQYQKRYKICAFQCELQKCEAILFNEITLDRNY